jgi:HlyD family secretion protein
MVLRHSLGGVLVIFLMGFAAGCRPVPSPPAGAASVHSSRAPVFGEIAAVARGRVDIEGGIVRLAARRDGVIASVLVEGGDRVRTGQVLATLDDDLARRNLSLAEREVEELEIMVRRTRLERAAADREVKRLEPLAARETVSGQDLDRARDARDLAEVAVQTATATVATARARQAVAARELIERQVVAPADGQIIQRQARPGNGVSTLNVTPLFLFAPDGPRIVRAELEEQYLAAVRVGQPVQTILEAQPDRTWAGKVVRVGRLVGERTPSNDPKERQDAPVVEVVIALDAEALLIGQRVIVRFLGGTEAP